MTEALYLSLILHILHSLSLTEPVFLPHVVLPQASLRVKAMLQHQPWNLEYCLDPSEYVYTHSLSQQTHTYTCNWYDWRCLWVALIVLFLTPRVDDMDSIEKGVKQLLTILPE